MGAAGNRVTEFRQRMGLAASRLAAEVGVSRQTIYSIEAGLYVPNTMVALKLARALESTVEELFAAAGEEEKRFEKLLPIDGRRVMRAGEPVQICVVGEKRIAAPAATGASVFPEADGVVAESRAGRVLVEEIRRTEGDDLVIAGCDPAMPLLAAPLRKAGVRLVAWTANSSDALRLLKEGRVHVAGCHIKDRRTGEANAAFVKKYFRGGEAERFGFATWEEGFVVAPGNPLRIRGVEDLARSGVRLANREAGSGTRRLLDGMLEKAGIEGGRIPGYERGFGGHVAAAREVLEGRADCCVSVRSAARLVGLDFVPMEEERYEFVVASGLLKTRAVEALLEELGRPGLRRAMEEACGYGMGESGERLGK